MALKLIVKLRRVKKGEEGSRPFYVGGYAKDEFPSDGFVITTNDPSLTPVFLRDSDIESARASENTITADSWEIQNGK